MKAVVFLGERQVKVIDVDVPEPGKGEVLVQIKASGLCGSSSDLKPYRMPENQLTEQQRSLVRGHEPCGVVARLGPGTNNVEVGSRVMVHHYRGCGKCLPCLSGWPQMCHIGFGGYGLNLPGGHAEYMVCVQTACVPMLDELSFEEAACISCGASTAYQALKRLRLSGFNTLAVFGQGFVGLAATMLANAAGVRVIAVDLDDERLMAASRFGAWATVNSSSHDPVEAIRTLTGGLGVDAGLDCSGADVAQTAMMASVKSWGQVCFVGVGTNPKLDILQVTRKQVTMYGSWTFGTRELAELGDLVVSRRLPLGDLITHRFPLDDAAQAYRLLDKGVTGKIVLVC
jgi:2-desacetyl-2-hydroxyethyl bacteriochlorophyllide A dehydrogenase